MTSPSDFTSCSSLCQICLVYLLVSSRVTWEVKMYLECVFVSSQPARNLSYVRDLELSQFITINMFLLKIGDNGK